MRKVLAIAVIGVVMFLSIGKADAACYMSSTGGKVLSVTPYSTDCSFFNARIVDSAGRNWIGRIPPSNPYFQALLTAMGAGLTVRIAGDNPTCPAAGGHVGTITWIQFTK